MCMRIVLQKVSQASVSIEPESDIPETLDFKTQSISHGLVLLVGIEDSDSDNKVNWAARKIANMRIFEDENGKMNRSVLDVNGEILSISQFTLYADIHKGNHPSFISAGEPAHAQQLWKQLNDTLRTEYNLPVKEGIFGSHMNVSLTNDGPVTIIINTETSMPKK